MDKSILLVISLFLISCQAHVTDFQNKFGETTSFRRLHQIQKANNIQQIAEKDLKNVDTLWVDIRQKFSDGTVETNTAIGTAFSINEEGHIITNAHVADPDLEELKRQVSINNLFKEDKAICIDDNIVEDKGEAEDLDAVDCVEPVFVEEVEIDYYIINAITLTFYELVAADHSKDIAILKPKTKKKSTYVNIDFDKKPNLGEFVLVLGSPANWDDTISFGILAHKRRYNDYLASGTYLYQISVPITHGSSGSPVFDMDGNVFCLVNGGADPDAAIAFCIPIRETRDFIEKNTYVGKKRLDFQEFHPSP